MKILVPTDFSDNAKHAMVAARELAVANKGSITLLYAFYVMYDFAAQVAEMEEQIKKDAIKKAERDVKLLQEAGVAADYKIVRNTVSNAILSTAQDLGYDLIVMGTQGSSGIKKALFGSNTASVIKNTDIPVLAIPSQADFEGIRTIAWAVEDLADTRPFLHRARHLIGYMQVPYEIVHVTTEGRTVDDFSVTDLTLQLKESYPTTPLDVTLIQNDVVGNGLDRYIQDYPGVLLVMFSKGKSFFESIFTRSHSVQMAYHTHVPLLVIKG